MTGRTSLKTSRRNGVAAHYREVSVSLVDHEGFIDGERTRYRLYQNAVEV